MSLFGLLSFAAVNVQIVLRLNTFLGKYSHERKMLGFWVNLRRMTVEILPSKREEIV
jgi:hypothetical protein